MTRIVILPGLDGTTALLDNFCANCISQGVSAHAMAYPPDRPLGYKELELLVRAQLPSSGPFVLLGESFSGPLAVQIAAHPPPNLVGVILSTTFARTPVLGLSPFAPLVRWAPARPPMPLLSWVVLGPWATPELQTQLAHALQSVSPAALRARAAAALRIDVSGLLPSVHLPVLQLVARHDRLLASRASKALTAGLPSCQTVTVNGPHLLLQTAVQVCAAHVAAFALGLGSIDSLESTP